MKSSNRVQNIAQNQLKILESEAKQFHYILIDMKNNINDTMRKAIEKSQQIFIVMEPNLLSAKEAVKSLI